MTVVNSTFAVGEFAQADGRKYVEETHTDNLGVAHKVSYLAETGAPYDTILQNRALQISIALAETEAGTLTNG